MRHWNSRQILLPVMFLIVLLTGWQLADQLFEFKRIILPNPLEIAQESWARGSQLFQATLVTGRAAMTGFVISVSLGTILALLFSSSALVKACMYPPKKILSIF